MKYILILVGLIFFSSNYAQTKANCYEDYLKLFKARKTFALTDGEHNVVVTIRDLKDNACYSVMGKISTEDGQINSKLFLKNSKGNYVPHKKELHENYTKEESTLKLNLKVVDGMSSNFLTQDKHVINLFFIDFLKPKGPGLQEAPDVSTYK